MEKEKKQENAQGNKGTDQNPPLFLEGHDPILPKLVIEQILAPLLSRPDSVLVSIDTQTKSNP
jgi:hypothetical protein